MFRAIILPIFRITRLFFTACDIIHPRCCRPVAGRQHRGCIIPQAVTHSTVLLKMGKIMLPAGGRPAASCVHYTTSCNTQYSAPEDGQNNCPKHVELTGIINKPLSLHLVGCLYYLYQWSTVKQISDNEIYLLIKYIKRVLCRVAKSLSYIEDARCLKVKQFWNILWRHKKFKGYFAVTVETWKNSIIENGL